MVTQRGTKRAYNNNIQKYIHATVKHIFPLP